MACSKQRNPAACLTDDLIVEILARLPAKSLSRFKCVSPSWRDLISHPDHRKKLPQTLAGFFYNTRSRERFPECARHFTNVSGRGAPLISPSLSFLPGHGDVVLLDCCNGLLLCRCRATGASYRYVVCNPATKEWVAVPESSQSGMAYTARLGFDPAVSSHFHVFEFVETDPQEGGYVFVAGLEIYSSKARHWAHAESGWSNNASLYDDMSTVFLNGFLHVFDSQHQDVLVVDTDGKVWRTIAAPSGSDDGFIGHSRGQLYYLNTMEDHDFKLTVYVLEDYSSDDWVFKHMCLLQSCLEELLVLCSTII